MNDFSSAVSPEDWDAWVAGSVKPHIFQTRGWGELKQTMGWRPHFLSVAAVDGRRAGMLVLERDIPVLRRRLFYAPRAPVLEAGWTPEDVDLLFDRADALARERRAVMLKIDPDVSADNDWISASLLRRGFRPAPSVGGFSGVQGRRVFRLDIHRTVEEILKTMDQKTRYNIRLAEKRGVKIRLVSSDEDIRTFQGLLAVTARRDGFLPRPLSYFMDMKRFLVDRGQGQFFLAERDGKAIAGSLTLAQGPLAWYAYGASANEGREHMPNYLMQWTMIQWARDHGCKVYDFRAVPTDPAPDHPLYGLYRFKKGFGGALTHFVGEHDRVYAPWLYRLWTRAWPLFKKARGLLLIKRRSASVEE